jgi:hypothetical protein
MSLNSRLWQREHFPPKLTNGSLDDGLINTGSYSSDGTTPIIPIHPAMLNHPDDPFMVPCLDLDMVEEVLPLALDDTSFDFTDLASQGYNLDYYMAHYITYDFFSGSIKFYEPEFIHAEQDWGISDFPFVHETFSIRSRQFVRIDQSEYILPTSLHPVTSQIAIPNEVDLHEDLISEYKLQRNPDSILCHHVWSYKSIKPNPVANIVFKNFALRYNNAVMLRESEFQENPVSID